MWFSFLRQKLRVQIPVEKRIQKELFFLRFCYEKKKKKDFFLFITLRKKKACDGSRTHDPKLTKLVQ